MRTFLSVLFLSSITVPAIHAENNPYEPFRQEPFEDVQEGRHALFESIDSLRERNILRGYPDGTYKPNARINRAEFVYLITNPLILDTERMNLCISEQRASDSDTTVYYPDVHEDVWYAAAVCHATNKGLIDGYPNRKFMPGEYINFVEAAKIVSSALALQTDAEPAGEKWFMPYIEALSKRGAIPSSVRTYGQMLTRGEMAEMVYRLLDDVEDRPHTDASQLSF